MLGLICGAGDLPLAVSEARGGALVCVLDGFAPNGLQPDLTFRLETLGTLLETLRARGVQQVCFCGHIARPGFDPSALDAATMPLVPRFTQALALGDDGALRIVLAIFAEAGFKILAAHEAAPRLLPDAGVPTKAQPGALDLSLGDTVLAQMGAADAGQACVLRAGQVIAREDAAGTDAMLARLEGQGTSGLLFKGPKPQQDRRADLPVIGPATVKAAAKAGLAGIVVEAGGVMVLHLDQVIAACDAQGLFLWVRPKPAGSV